MRITSNHLRKFLLIASVLYASLSMAQSNENEESDKYSLWEEAFLKSKNDTTKARKIAANWLKNAKAEHNDDEQVNAYKALMHVAEKEYRMIYADSLLEKALTTKDNETIGEAYLTIGTAHYNQYNNALALRNYITAQTYISKTDNPYLIHKIKYATAQTNYHLGYYDEAIALFRDCMAYFVNENETAYIKALHGIGLCYHHVNRYDLSSFHNQLGIKISLESKYHDLIPYFKLSEGLNQYKWGAYNKALNIFTLALPEMKLKGDFCNQALTVMHIGKCWAALQNNTKAVDQFIKADLLITEHHIAHPYLRDNFEALITHYKASGNKELRLHYSEKLIAFDKIITKEYKYLSYKLYKANNNQIKDGTTNNNPPKKSNNQNSIYYLLAAGMLLGSVFWIRYSYQIYRKKNPKTPKVIPKKELSNEANAMTLKKIGVENQKALLHLLEKFEKNKKFTAKGISLTSLATAMQTNTRYASAIVAHYRGKNVTKYLNDLKIDQIIHLLQTDKQFRKHTNEALANEVGFGSTQIFTKAFKEKINKSPNDFIKELIQNTKSEQEHKQEPESQSKSQST